MKKNSSLPRSKRFGTTLLRLLSGFGMGYGFGGAASGKSPMAPAAAGPKYSANGEQ